MQNIHDTIINKINAIKSIDINLLKLQRVTNYNYIYRSNVDVLEKKYTNKIFVSLFNNDDDEIRDTIIESNIVTYLDFISSNFVRVFNQYKKRLFLDEDFKGHSEINNLCMKIQNNIDYITSVKIKLDSNVRYIQCDNCGTQKIIDYDKSEIICEYCYTVEPLIGKLQHVEYVNIDKVSPGKNEVTRHLKKWLNAIQGNSEISSKTYNSDLDNIKKYIVKMRLKPHELNVVNMRAILKSLKLTKYNSHITRIIIDCGGSKPPQLTNEEFDLICKYTNKIFEIKESLSNPCNKKPYYPYYIYKVFENLLDDNKKVLMDYIHVQDKKTLQKCDNEFKIICDELQKIGINNISYKPTVVYR